MLIFKALAYVIALITLCTIAYSDLRTREVDHEWRYIIIIACGLLTGGNWIEKLLCLIVVPLAMIGSGSLIAKIKSKKKNREHNVIDIIGGADIKIIASCGFTFGMIPMILAILISSIFAIPFLLSPTLGVKKKIRRNDPDIGGIPFCFLLAFGIITFYGGMAALNYFGAI